MVAEGTLALTLERPDRFEFQPGQNTTISLPGVHADDLRELSLASAPYERDLVIATRTRNSEFKHAYYSLKPGDAIMVRDPAGSLWLESDAPQVWLSGGIGITPFRSIMRELLHTTASLAVTHIHSDRLQASIPFLQEFESYTAAHTGYRFTPTLTRASGHEYHRGRISADLIAALSAEYAGSEFFVVGTDAFVASMRNALDVLGVPSDQVRTEKFEGYKRHNA